MAARWKIHVADAIEPGLVARRAFGENRLPQLLALMSPARRAELAGG